MGRTRRKVDVEREVERLAALPWTVEMRRNHDGSMFARVVELFGCMTEGADREATLRNLDNALRLWLATELERGAHIPAPLGTKDYSGKFMVRTSPLVHRMAAETAERLGVSLNEFAGEAIALLASGAMPTPAYRSRSRTE